MRGRVFIGVFAGVVKRVTFWTGINQENCGTACVQNKADNELKALFLAAEDGLQLVQIVTLGKCLKCFPVLAEPLIALQHFF